MILFLIIILSLYFATVGLLIYGFTNVKLFESTDISPKTKFSIIVPFRDEAENLPFLLDSISKLNYPMELFEVILIDDDSTDCFKVKSLKFKTTIIKNIRVSNSPKKDAIVTAMRIATSDWIITTDADCLVTENWLLTLDNYIQTHDVSMIAGAVAYECNNSFLHHFQQLDLASLQGATIGSFGIGKGFMCNGANLAYTRTLFQELNGFEGNNSIASGDDVFLLQKAITQFPDEVHYLKSENNLVFTKPLNDTKSLFYQRVRWASKTTSYQSSFGKILGLIVFSGNLALLLAFFIGLFSFSTSIISIQKLSLLLLIKFCVDAILILQTNHFLNTTKTRYLILSSVLYPFFSVSVALYSFYGKYEWKGRDFRS
jgi:glycosyltransferase involved in cell wall biosynthesis